MSKYMLWSPMYFWDTLQGGNASSLSFLDMNNTPLIV
jgi:hypothetical protein